MGCLPPRRQFKYLKRMQIPTRAAEGPRGYADPTNVHKPTEYLLQIHSGRGRVLIRLRISNKLLIKLAPRD